MLSLNAVATLILQGTLHSGDTDQGFVFDTIRQAATSRKGGIFFLEGFGGTRKLFLINFALAKVRSDGNIAFNTSFATTILDGGTTAQSRFEIRIDTRWTE